MTDTTFFIETKAAFEHAFSVGAIAEADADDFMYMQSTTCARGPTLDHFKHRDTRKYTRVRRHVFIEPDTVQAVARGPEDTAAEVSPDVKLTADAQALARHFDGKLENTREKMAARRAKMAEARAEADRLQRVRDAGPQLLKALVDLYAETAAPMSVSHHAWLSARKEAKAAIEAAVKVR